METKSVWPSKLPPRFVPYLEKHRIYQLFYELTQELIMKQPRDHILFLKQVIYRKGYLFMNSPRVILFAPSYIDLDSLVNYLSQATRAYPVNPFDVKSAFVKCDTLDETNPGSLAGSTSKLLSSEHFYLHGWIMHGFPRNRMEAVSLQKLGVLPTHVIALIPPRIGDEDFSIMNTPSVSKQVKDREMCQYLAALPDLKFAYKSIFKECNIEDRTMEELVKDITKIIKVMPHTGVCMLPRVLLVGCRGSGVKTQAKILAERFNLVNLNFEYILQQEKLREDYLSEHIQHISSTSSEKVIANIVEKSLLQESCLCRGWVLTGYPRNVVEFKLLDAMETPPNRVIFIEVNTYECFERIIHRRINIFTGKRYHLLTDPPPREEIHQLSIHPQDEKMCVIEQVNKFMKSMKEMKYYCKDTAIYINGEDNQLTVTEKIHAVVMRPAPPVRARNPHQNDETFPDEEDKDDDDDKYKSDEQFIIEETRRVSNPYNQEIVRH